MIKALKHISLILFILLLLILSVLAVLTIFEYRPAEEETVTVISGTMETSIPANADLRVLTWNIGYGALGDNADFFMDGGTSVYTADKARVQQNLQSILQTIETLNPDFCLLQEVDVDSDRSRHIDEVAFFCTNFPDYYSAFANNYRVLYVPFPIPPIGHVDSGILTLSRCTTNQEATRITLPCPFSWPIRLAQLKRCLQITRHPVSNGKELVLVNLHLEAYDSGAGKTAQTRTLVSFLRSEIEKGNYVIAGGDFNQYFSEEDAETYAVRKGLWKPGILERDLFGDGLILLSDGAVPSCRSLDQPYAGADPKGFQYYAIDGFIVSDNVEILSIQTQNVGFEATDHNPVLLIFRLGMESISEE